MDSKILNANLICSYCCSGNCKLFRHAYPNHEMPDLYCFQCLFERKLVSSKNEVLFGNKFLYPGSGRIEEFDYLVAWSKLPTIPEWFKFNSEINRQRAFAVYSLIEYHTNRLSIGRIMAYEEFIGDEFFIVYFSTNKKYTIPQMLHALSWLENISGSLTERQFYKLLEKIRVKY